MEFPAKLDKFEVLARIRAVLHNAPANREVWTDPRFDWENGIYWECRRMGVHPAWPLTSLQRERSLLGRKGAERDFDLSQGVVGQHAPGTQHPDKTGLWAQTLFSIRSVAWSMGLGPDARFEDCLGTKPPWERWKDGIENLVQLYNDVPPYARLTRKTPAQDKWTYAQMVFTPSSSWDAMLDKNGQIWSDYVAPWWPQ